MPPTLLATMVTTTTYGSWLPGDLRGYVEDSIILPGDPERLEHATQRMQGRSAILFTPELMDSTSINQR